MKKNTLLRIDQISTTFNNEKETKSADELFLKYLGKKGEINTLLKQIVSFEKDKQIEKKDEECNFNFT